MFYDMNNKTNVLILFTDNPYLLHLRRKLQKKPNVVHMQVQIND